MRCDLHVHTRHSGRCPLPLLRKFCRDSYNDPEALYDVLKRRGMDLVTVTDHDSIEAAERLRRHADFFPSEEVTCTAPSGTKVHIGVYNLSERDHEALQRRRDDFPSLVACLRERRLLTSVHHLFSSVTGRRAAEDFLLFEALFPLVETRNGRIPAANNRQAEKFAEQAGRAAIGGSDAHTMGPLGKTYTEVPGARSKEEFLAGLWRGQCRPGGETGSYGKTTQAIWSAGLSMVRENPWGLALLSLAPAAPLASLVYGLREKWFLRCWGPRLEILCDEPLLRFEGDPSRW